MSKRDDILQATQSIIASEGVMNATIGNILKKAGTGYGTLYNYFDSKEDLYLTLYITILSDIENYVRAQIEECVDLAESFRLILRHYVVYSLNHIDEFNALEALRFVPDICAAAKDKGVGQVGLDDLVEEGEAYGAFQKRADGYNAQVIVGMVSIFVRFFHGIGEEPDDGQIEDFIKTCMNALK